jgi:DNA invertase Pin-like site-specific DNA recombinase
MSWLLLGVGLCKSPSQKDGIVRELLQHSKMERQEHGMKLGYARVSTAEQHLTMQLDLLRQANCERLFQEKHSGAVRDRVALGHLLEQLRAGDTVVVWRLDRLARSTRDLLEIIERIHHAGAAFQSLAEPWADTTSTVGKFIMTVLAGLAEFERDLIRERTRVGRDAARRRGVRFGRPPKLNSDQCALARRLLNEGQAAQQVAKIFGVHVATIYRLSGTDSAEG